MNSRRDLSYKGLNRLKYYNYWKRSLMEGLKIKGGAPLKGHIKAAGAKNAMTKLLVASLLSDKKCVFYNVPNIGDVDVTVALCQEIGMEVAWDKQAGIMEVITKELKTSYVPQRFSGANRIPILMIGALLSRTEEDIIVPTVGGCDIGQRSVDFHIQALQQLGANIEYRGMKRRSEERRVGKECLTVCVDLGGRRIIQAEDGIRDISHSDWSSDVCSSDLWKT